GSHGDRPELVGEETPGVSLAILAIAAGRLPLVRPSARPTDGAADSKRSAGVARESVDETVEPVCRDLVIGIEKIDEGSLAFHQADVARSARIPDCGGD